MAVRRRRVLWGLVALGLLLAALPALQGWWLEQRLRTAFAALPEGLSAHSLSISRGWFSTRVLSVHRPWPRGPFLRLDHRFEHGPLLAAGVFGPGPVLGLASVRGRLDLGAGAALAHGRGWLGYAGALQLQWLGERPRPALGPGRDWLRLEGGSGGTLALQARVAELALAGGLRLADLKLHLVLRDGPGRAPRLEALGMSLAALRWRDGAVDRLRLQAEGLEAGLGLRGEAAGLALAGARWGPGRIELVVGPQAAGLLRLPGLSPERWPAVLSGTRIEVPSLSLAGPRGRLALSLDLRLDAARPPAPDALQSWLASASGTASVQVSAALLREELERLTRGRLALALAADEPGAADRRLLREDIDERAAVQTARRLALFVNRGYLQRVPGGYRTHLELADGRLSMNGKPVNLAQFMPK